MFLHFTSAQDAAEIASGRRLDLSQTIVNTVYAVAVGGRRVPGVQHTRTGSRDVAVLFTTGEAPDTWYPEEVIWHRRTPLSLSTVRVLPAAEADTLLDGSAAIPDDGIHHRTGCGCPGCACYRQTAAGN